MMKKITALLLAMVMVFALCACGNNSDDKKTDDNADASKIKVGFIFLHDENSTYDLNFINAARGCLRGPRPRREPVRVQERTSPKTRNATTQLLSLLTTAATSSSPTASATRPS